jgi:hypothetical protein
MGLFSKQYSVCRVQLESAELFTGYCLLYTDPVRILHTTSSTITDV